MMEIETVLCPTDFSALSDKELGLATQICDRFGARMIVQHNIDDVPPIYLANAWMYSETHMYPEEEKEAQASRLLKAAFEKLPKSIKYEGRITFGRLDECILHLARELPADLIVMGTHGASNAEHVSHTDRVLAQSPCPVLTTRETSSATVLPDLTDGSSLQTVVLPMDFSAHSLHALEYALSLLDVLPLKLHLLHVEATMALDDLLALAHSPNLGEQKRQRIIASEDRLKSLVPTKYLSRVRFAVRMGSVVNEIIAYAQNVRATLIVMGAHAKNVLDRLIFGANSQGVLHRSPCPVWLVPQKEGHSKPWVVAATQAGRNKGAEYFHP
jgi:nucleotide-binding universal stress UspA family protein